MAIGGSFRRRWEFTGQQWRAQYRYRPGGCPVVKPEDFVDEALAKKLLGLRTGPESGCWSSGMCWTRASAATWIRVSPSGSPGHRWSGRVSAGQAP